MNGRKEREGAGDEYSEPETIRSELKQIFLTPKRINHVHPPAEFRKLFKEQSLNRKLRRVGGTKKDRTLRKSQEKWREKGFSV